MRPTIYIAGAVTGEDPTECAAKFDAMEYQILAKGYKVINPVKLVNDTSCSWDKAMRICLKALRDVDGIFMLPCSVYSRGAKIELQFAIEKNKDIYSEIHELKQLPTHEFS